MDIIVVIITVIVAIVLGKIFIEKDKGEITERHEKAFNELKAQRKKSEEAHKKRVEEITKEVKNATPQEVVDRFHSTFGSTGSPGTNTRRPKRLG